MADNPTADLSGIVWCAIVVPQYFMIVFLDTVLVPILVFIGLYVGSMLRKPKTN